MTDDDLVNVTTKGGIAELELSDPPANTYTYEMMQELDEAILDARMDDEVHVIVLTGDGDSFFSAGADIGMLQEAATEFKYCFCLHANETLNRLEQTPKLTIAALNGHTVGGGLEIAMACDLRVAKADGGNIGLPEVNLGVLPGTGGTQRLPRLIGESQAIEWMTKGELHSFEEAAEVGLINEIIDSDDFRGEVLQYAEQFCPPNAASKAIGHIKRSVTTGSEIPFQEALALERELQQRLFESEDATEGLAAYVEDRDPEFSGE